MTDLFSPYLIAQIINLLLVVVWLGSVLKMVFVTCRKGNGPEAPLWILVIVIIPLLGALSAYLYFRGKDLEAGSSMRSND